MTTDTERYIEELEAEVARLKATLREHVPNRFRIFMELEWTVTDMDKIWPNGDAPANPTASDVRKVLQEYGEAWMLIRDWDLSELVELSVVEVEP